LKKILFYILMRFYESGWGGRNPMADLGRHFKIRQGISFVPSGFLYYTSAEFFVDEAIKEN